MASCDIDFTHYIVEEIQDGAFQRSTTIPFLCLVHMICIDATVEIIHNVDFIKYVQRTCQHSHHL